MGGNRVCLRHRRPQCRNDSDHIRRIEGRVERQGQFARRDVFGDRQQAVAGPEPLPVVAEQMDGWVMDAGLDAGRLERRDHCGARHSGIEQHRHDMVG